MITVKAIVLFQCLSVHLILFLQIQSLFPVYSSLSHFYYLVFVLGLLILVDPAVSAKNKHSLFFPLTVIKVMISRSFLSKKFCILMHADVICLGYSADSWLLESISCCFLAICSLEVIADIVPDYFLNPSFPILSFFLTFSILCIHCTSCCCCPGH